MSVPCRGPAADGVNVTVTLQLEEAARVAPQVLLEIEKSPAFDPEIAMLSIATAEVPRLVRVTVLGVPDDPSATSPHTRFWGSIRTPATKQPVTQNTFRKRIALRNNRSVRHQPSMFPFDLRVKKPSSSFILLGGKRTKDEGNESTKQQSETSKEHYPWFWILTYRAAEI